MSGNGTWASAIDFIHEIMAMIMRPSFQVLIFPVATELKETVSLNPNRINTARITRLISASTSSSDPTVVVLERSRFS